MHLLVLLLPYGIQAELGHIFLQSLCPLHLILCMTHFVGALVGDWVGALVGDRVGDRVGLRVGEDVVGLGIWGTGIIKVGLSE